MQATANSLPVLITGESGTGKELFAQAIHHGSPRKIYPFVRINCAAIPNELIETELFGYEKGAFTGALGSGKPGKFEIAHNGSIFLDEIGELPLQMQPKLLRVLEEKEFERVGGTRLIRPDFRVIAATNRNLEEMMAKGQFRRDLYYRLNVISLTIPPLRERREDILPLAHHLMRQITVNNGLKKARLARSVERIFQHCNWKGNTRELSNVIEQTLAKTGGEIIRAGDLPFYLHERRSVDTNPGAGTLKEVQIRAEREAIRHALEKTGYHKANAARMLGIHRTLLYKKAAKYNIRLSPDEPV
ncbi:MAG: sigma-54 interaction domain-containing protein [Desulfopila sp.]